MANCTKQPVKSIKIKIDGMKSASKKCEEKKTSDINFIEGNLWANINLMSTSSMREQEKTEHELCYNNEQKKIRQQTKQFVAHQVSE